jgi:hypothetical protein
MGEENESCIIKITGGQNLFKKSLIRVSSFLASVRYWFTYHSFSILSVA